MTEGERLRELENRLWQAADQLRAKSTLSASQYSTPVLGLIFLRYADVRFTQAERELEGKASSRRDIGKADYQALRPADNRIGRLLPFGPSGEMVRPHALDPGREAA